VLTFYSENKAITLLVGELIVSCARFFYIKCSALSFWLCDITLSLLSRVK
jgi:hypothetical protein